MSACIVYNIIQNVWLVKLKFTRTQIRRAAEEITAARLRKRGVPVTEQTHMEDMEDKE